MHLLETRTLLSVTPGEVVVSEFANASIGIISEANDGSMSLVGSYAAAQSGGNDEFDDFQLAGRWTDTATNGSGLTQGTPTTLTWSFADDGSSIPGFNGEPTSNSSLIAFLDTNRGAGPGGSDLTQRPWFSLFSDSFDRMSAVSGLIFVYEPNDDAVAFSSVATTSPGVLGVRGDIRIGGHFIDGQSGSNILAYNFFPNNGEMVIDTGNPIFYSDTANNSVGFRNVIMHENGHGIGLNHVESSDAAFLMEPFINTAFDGPQLDDILALQRHYGDALEEGGGNDTTATAVSLGTVLNGTTVSRGTLGNSTVVTATQTDFISIDDEADTDVFSFTVAADEQIILTLTPRGVTYQQGPQGGAQSAFDVTAQSDLILELLDTDGTTVLRTANATGLGGGESIPIALTNAGTYYARITGATVDKLQLYGLTVESVGDPNSPPVINNQAFSVPENSPIGTPVGTVLATDPDVGQVLTYAITAGNTNNTFAINFTTGQITVNNPALLDFEASPIFNLTVTVTDNGIPTLSDSANVTITVTNVNEAPTSQSLSFTTQEDVPLNAFLVGNDPDGTTPSFVILTQGANGTVALLSGGQFIYTPKSNFSGNDSFTYRVTDGQFNSPTSTVSIVVTPVNDPPTASPIAITVNANVTSTGRLWSFDPDTATVTYLLSTAPRAGTVTITASGNFSYTPNLDFFGTDQFEFVVSDGNSLSAPATVTITVLKPNFAPEAYALQLSANEDTVLNGRLWGFDPEGATLTYALASPPKSGSGVTIQSNGNFRYTPKANFFGRDEFTFTVSDGQRASKAATVVIDVKAVNDPPIAYALSLNLNEDTKLTGARAWGFDLEGTALTYQLMSNPTKGKVTFNSNGTFNYTPNANYNGPDQFSFRVNDGAANSNTAVISLNVQPVNDAPVAANQTVVTKINTSLNGQLVATDIDSTALTYALVVSPTRGRVTLNANGSFVYTPNSNYTGPDLFTYKATDGQLNSAIATVNITVQPATTAALSTGTQRTTVDDDVDETLVDAAVPVATSSPAVESPLVKERKLRRGR